MPSVIDKSNNAELGLATGTTVNAGNSGGGGQSAFDTVNIGAGCTHVVSSSSPLSGSFSFIATQTSTGTLERYMVYGSVQTDGAFQKEFVHATPAVNLAFLRSLQTTAKTGTSCTVFARTDNKWHIFDSVSGTQSAASSGALTAGTTYVFQYWEESGAAHLRIFPKGSTTATVSIDMTIGNTVGLGAWRDGIPTASANITLKDDNIKIGHGGFLSRTDVTNTPPTASTGPAQFVAVGATVNLVGSDSDSDGTVASRAWTWDTSDTSGPLGTTRKWATGPTISGAGTQNATAVMSTPGAYRAKYTVSDDQGASAEAFTTVFVYPASGAAVGVRHAVKGSWVRTGGSDDTAVLNDANDATGHISPNNPTGQADTFLMMPHGPGTSAVTFTVRGNSQSGTVHRVVQWWKPDGTEVDSQEADAPTSLANQVFTMDSGGRAALGALADLAELVVTVKSTAV